jgi:peptide/nickel transport system permease protein
MTGLVVGQLLSGTVVTETVFSRPGIGRVTAVAVQQQDIPVVQGIVLFAAGVFVLANLAVDLIYPLLDPRIVLSAPRRRRRRIGAGDPRVHPDGSGGATEDAESSIARADEPTSTRTAVPA